ncbi:MAG: DNA-protecting protein DprA [Clostridia bacterium]|nr:DNA-protecting protein DprA [Clostridia bacterium]
MKSIRKGEKNYPKQLLEISDPPEIIYVLGDETILKNFGIGIVGTRNSSQYGEEITRALAYGLAKEGVNIISGLAKGIDTAAHAGALLAKGRTIAVLGGGFGNIYPRENIELIRNIINKGGAVITEYEINEKTLPQNFPKRNRIISGLSSGIIVTEAKERSGSLITADFALDQGREVFAVPR